MFKALREKLASWRQKAEAEVAAEEAPATKPAADSAAAVPAKSAPARGAAASRPAPSRKVIGDSGRKLKESRLEEILYDLEIALLESDVAFPVAKEIVDTLAEELQGKRVSREVTVERGVEEALRDAITKAMTVPTIDLFEIIKSHEKPIVIMFVGVNGTGKTTTIAKLAYHIQKRGYTRSEERRVGKEC